MKIITADTVPDMEITQTIGMVRGNVVRARFFGRDILAGLRMIIGGEVVEYTKLMAEAREQALDRMIKHAEGLGADTIITVRFTTSMVMQGAAEILVTGTAVKTR